MPILKWKDASNWISLYADAIKNRLKRDLNLADLTNKQEARKNLEIIGDNNHTHYHDDRYTLSRLEGAPLNHASTSSTYGLGSSMVYGHVKASSIIPSSPGVADLGNDDSTYARGTHVHPPQEVISNGAANDMRFNWSERSDQPTWIWGGNNPNNMYIYDPSKLNVNYADTTNSAKWADSAGNADTVGGLTIDQIKASVDITTKVAFVTGQNKGNAYIPLPAGFTEAQCKFYWITAHPDNAGGGTSRYIGNRGGLSTYYIAMGVKND